MFKGLYLYEVMLMVAGAVLFLVLIFILIWYVIKNKKIVALLPFFLIPIIMIGWTSITSLSYINGKIEIQKNASSLINDPSDSSARKALESSIANFNTSRAGNDPVALNSISRAYYALGRYDNATTYNDKALQLNPNLEEAVTTKAAIQKQVYTNNTYATNVQQLKILNNDKNIPDSAKVKQIVSILHATPQPVYTDEKSNLVIAKSLASVNQREKSLEIVDNVLKANPQSPQAVQIKKDILNKKYDMPNVDSGKIKSLAPLKFKSIIQHSKS